MVESLTGQAAVTISSAGGTILAFEDQNVRDGWMLAYIGSEGDDTDEPAYPAERGKGMAVRVLGGAFRIAAPVLAVGGPYYLTLVRVGGTGDFASLTSNAFITVTPKALDSQTFSLRNRFYRELKVGPRTPDGVEYPQV